MKSHLLLLIGLLLLGLSDGERILALFAVSTKSHNIAFQPIAEALAGKGHHVTIVTPFPSKKKTDNINEIVVGSTFNDLDTDWFKMQGQSPLLTVSSIMVDFRSVTIAGYRQLMANEDFRKIVDTKAVDLVVVDAILNDFTLPIVDELKVPFVYYSPAAGTAWTLEAMAVSPEYAYVPAGLGDYGTKMTFKERVINMLATEIFLPVRKMALLSYLDSHPAVRKDFPNARPIAEIERDAELCIINSHPVTAFIRPLPPNVIPIGALHVRPAQTLPAELDSFADGADHGFVVFTLGSAIPVSSMPPAMVEVFVKVFARLPQRVFWKWENSSALMDNLSDNVRIVDWLPQQDLLGHKNCRVFITHGGMIGLQEAAYHGVPLLGLPLGNDQRGNLAKAKDEGYALKLAWNDLTETLLYETLQDLLNKPRFRESAARVSRLMRDELVPGRDVAVYWIEHVLRHGGAKHLQTRAKELPFYKLYLLDVWLLLSTIFVLVLYATFRTLKWIVRKTATKKEKQS